MMLESSGRKDNVRRRVQCGLGRILQYTDHKTDSHHLHSDVLVNTEQSAGERNQQERAPPGTPEAPQAQTAATTERSSAVKTST